MKLSDSKELLLANFYHQLSKASPDQVFQTCYEMGRMVLELQQLIQEVSSKNQGTKTAYWSSEQLKECLARQFASEEFAYAMSVDNWIICWHLSHPGYYLTCIRPSITTPLESPTPRYILIGSCFQKGTGQLIKSPVLIPGEWSIDLKYM